MKKILAPYGFKIPKNLDPDDEEAVKQLLLEVVINPDWQKLVESKTHYERLDLLKKNGFSIVDREE